MLAIVVSAATGAVPPVDVAPGSAAFDEGLIARWPFDDQTDPTEDVAGGHDGDIAGSPIVFDTSDIAPTLGNVASLTLNGSDKSS